MQSEGRQYIRVRLDQRCFFLTMLLILFVWHGYIKQHIRAHLRGLHLSTIIDQTDRTVKVSAPKLSSTRKLNFLVIGVQRAGTTALFHYLQQHPHLSLPKWKGSHFFDNETVNWTAPDYTTYESFGGSRTKSTIAGEVTSIYIYWPNSMERIKRYNIDMKLIILFRHPVERAWSQWRMECALGTETKPFPWVIKKGRDRLANSSQIPGYHRKFSYVERGFYGKQLQRVLTLFPRQQLLLLRSEDLKADPTKIIEEISRFLQVPPPEGKIKQLRSNVSPKTNTEAVLSKMDATYLQSVYNDDLKLFRDLSGLDITTWLT